MNLKKYENNRTFFIHYACGDFLNKENPIISAIVIKPYGKPVEIFSLAKEASTQNIDITGVVDKDTIERLEYGFLSKFYDYVKPKIQDEVQWIHWNMVNPGYSWRKINERISRLGIESNPLEPNTRDSHDLSEIFQEKYDEKFIEDSFMEGHTEHVTSVKKTYRKGKLYNLAIFNDMMRDDFLSGTEEYKLLEKGKGFVKIQTSTARKVQLIADFLKRDVKGNLRVQKDTSIPKRIERKLVQRPLIPAAFAIGLSFLGILISKWLGGILALVFIFLAGWLYIKD